MSSTARAALSEEAPSAAQRVLDVVTKRLESQSYDTIQLITVAQDAHMSLTTIYKHFPSRDDLMVAAVEHWMNENVYKPFANSYPIQRLPVLEALTQLIRTIYRPWEEHPRMLQAYMRAISTAPGFRLLLQGQTAVAPFAEAILAELDPSFAQDLSMILWHINHSVVASVAAGKMDITEVVPTFERTLRRLLDASTFQ